MRDTPSAGNGYRPSLPAGPHPIFAWPPKLAITGRFLFGFPGYLWPFPALFATVALLFWNFLTPTISSMATLSGDWILPLLIGNATLLILFAGLLHWRLYVQRAQGTQYKYNPRWLAAESQNFLLRNQVSDNAVWGIFSAVPIWTAYEVVTFWMQAKGFVPVVRWDSHPVYCVVLTLLTPFWMDVHFTAVHRALHWRPLYKTVHYLHHKNVNIGPWSGLAMHPIEHVLFFSAVAIFWVVPSHPFHAVYLLLYLAFGATYGHSGFHKIVLDKTASLATDHYYHFLHHKLVTVNYGNGLIPFDKWFGTFCDGTEESMQVLKERLGRAKVSGRGGERDERQ